MAQYLHRCDNEECDVEEFTDMRKMLEVDKETFCPKCNGLAPRIMHRTAFHLKGRGWERDGYGTRDVKGRPLGNAVDVTSLSSSTASKTHKK